MTNVRGEKTSQILKGALLSVALLGFAVSSVLAINIVRADKSEPYNDYALRLVNQTRSEHNLPLLKHDELLSRAASMKAQDMIDNDYFDHVSKDGEMVWSQISATGYDYSKAGENLAIDYSTLDGAYRGWLNSPSHLENILSENYSDFGFAQIEGDFEGNKTTVYVQLFGSKNNIYERILSKSGGEND
ncbi:MAG: Cysteine-rich secretory protein family protein [candidate division WS2 bacterium ADurb.Bin280]|uniref:Cysteine-rich secretory protein family protein n=1 Tax=candidate division WS2 bacterium ADurb.Bin280 TaxID=1852829 RepID=A0A1V5SFI7_9BACT|nr:MAG: Cysteine-rich secretory protein family protein [candidate division WS2 bacterium ADurb.Bin280]